jgi:hypothetical protein
MTLKRSQELFQSVMKEGVFGLFAIEGYTFEVVHPYFCLKEA